MQTSKENIAILVFAQSAKIDACLKAIPRSEPLFEYLTDKALYEVKKTNLPFFHFSEQNQNGDSFGERYANAIETVFNQGYQSIITIGNDSPLLTSEHIRRAAEMLENGQNVIGPSKDGGFYLLGIQRNYFDKETFIDLPWQTSSILAATQTYINGYRGTVLKLQYLRDIDSIIDAKKILKASKKTSTYLWALLQGLVDMVERSIFGPLLPNTSLKYFPSSDLARGSPS